MFAINAVSFLGTAVVLGVWRQSRPESHLPAETLAGATRAALRYVMNAPLLRDVLIRVALLMVPAAALQALLPIVVRQSLGLGSGSYGLLLGCFGGGAATAAVLRPRLEERASPHTLIVTSTLVLAGGLLVDGYVTQPVAVGLGLFVAGLGWTTAFTTTNVAAQSTLAAWVRARGMGLYMLVITGGIAIGSTAWGLLAEWSLPGAHAVAAGCLLAGLVIGRRHPLDEITSVDVTPVLSNDPVVTLSPLHDDGPVLVTVAYRVPPGDIAGFVEAMAHVERHRRRTGAYRWGLFRDLSDPAGFVESFVVDSWGEHLRQHQRVTVTSDARMDLVRPYLDPSRPPTHHISAYSPGVATAGEPAAVVLGEEV